MDTLTKWINDNAAPDAKSTLDKYTGPPEVASISSDGFSRGEDSYMNISINTAFSIGSAISDASPPDYVFHDKTLVSDTSTLGGSRTIPLESTRTWADMAAGHAASTGTSSTGQVSLEQSSAISDLASSRAEVESLKAKVAQMEAERIEQQKALADTVQEQVSKAVQDQMSIFTAQMTQLFASLASTLQQPQQALSKRSIHTMEFEDVIDQEQSSNNFVNTASKRWDNKTTPNKQPQMLSEKDNSEWQTPDATPKQHQAKNGGQQLSSEVKHLSLGLPSQRGGEGNMSQSDDEDITMRDSGIESKPKSLTSVIEAEARRCNDDRK